MFQLHRENFYDCSTTSSINSQIIEQHEPKAFRNMTLTNLIFGDLNSQKIYCRRFISNLHVKRLTDFQQLNLTIVSATLAKQL